MTDPAPTRLDWRIMPSFFPGTMPDAYTVDLPNGGALTICHTGHDRPDAYVLEYHPPGDRDPICLLSRTTPSQASRLADDKLEEILTI